MKNCKKGFTIIEMVVVITILSLVVGALAPVTVQIVDGRRAKVASENMDAIEKAIRDFCLANIKNPLFFPATLVSLSTTANRGPFLIPKIQNGINPLTTDPWGTNYSYVAVSATERTITSFGPNRAAGGNDDITLRIDIRDILREETFREIAKINAAIINLNKNFSSSILTTDSMNQTFTKLRAQNLIATGNDIERDELNNLYQKNNNKITSPVFGP